MPRTARRLLPALIALVILPSLGFGDWINLHNGGRIVGQIIRKNDREMTIRTQAGAFLTVQMRQVSEYFWIAEKDAKSGVVVPKGDEQGEVVYKQSSEKKDELRDEKFDNLSLRLPGGFQAVAPPVHIEGNGISTGAWKEGASGAVLTFTTGPTPSDAKSLDQVEARLKEQFLKEKQIVLRIWERRQVNGRPVIYGEFETVAGAKPETMFLFQWMELEKDRFCSLQLAAPRLRFLVGESVYRRILQSLRSAAEPAPAPQS